MTLDKVILSVKMKLLVALVFLLGSAVQCLADPECNGFLRTSCRNIYTARKCGKLPECVRLWRSSKWGKYRTDVSSDCTFCLHVASSPMDLRSTSVLCTLPPQLRAGVSYPALEPETCKDTVSSLINNTLNEVNEFTVCNVLNHCNSHTFIGHLNFGTALCDDCKKIIVDIQALLADNATSEAIASKLNDLICSGIPGQFADICRDTIRAHVKPVLDLINKQISPLDICALFGLCERPNGMIAQLSDLLSPELFLTETVRFPSVTHTPCPKETKFSWISRPSPRNHPKWISTSRIEQLSSILEDKPSGSQCVAVLEQIRTALKDPGEQQEIKNQIDKEICDTLPSFLQTMCRNAVNEHFDEIMAHLDKVDLKKVCTMFGMPPDNLAQHRKFSSYPGVCQVCEIIIHKLVDLVAKNVTETQVKRVLDTVCRLLPNVADKECEDFVEQYGAKIFAAIIEGTAPKLICMGLGLCNPIESAPKPSPPIPPVRDTYCDVCKLLVTMVEHQLTQNETEEQVERLLKNLCAVLPGSYVQECNSLVDQYLPLAMQYLTANLSPEEICETINLCKAKHYTNLCMRGPTFWCSSPAATAFCKAEAYCSLTAKDSDDCAVETLDNICENPGLVVKCGKGYECLIRQMDQYSKLMSNHKTGSPQNTQYQNCSICSQMLLRWQIHRALFGAPIVNEDTCKSFTVKADQEQCETVLKSRINRFQPMIRKVSDAEAICKTLQLCQVQLNGVRSSSDETTATLLACSKGPVYWCASRANAEACGTVNFCDALGWTVKDEEAKTTDSLELEVDIFGGNACTWGPTYWCQNEETAQRCGALDHCNKIVWRNDRVENGVGVQSVELKDPKDRCSWGPSYYCTSKERALECGQSYAEKCWQLVRQRNLS